MALQKGWGSLLWLAVLDVTTKTSFGVKQACSVILT